MCEATTQQLRMRRKGHYGHYKEDSKMLIANYYEEKALLNSNQQVFLFMIKKNYLHEKNISFHEDNLVITYY